MPSNQRKIVKTTFCLRGTSKEEEILWRTAAEKRDYTEIISHYKKRIAENSNDPGPYIFLSTADFFSHQLTDGIQNAVKAIELLTTYPQEHQAHHLAQAYTLLAINYYEEGDYLQALEATKKARLFNEEDTSTEKLSGKVSILNHLGMIYEKLDQIPTSIQNYQGAITLNPSMVAPYKNLGKLYLQQRRALEALDCFNKAIELAPNDYSIYHARIETCLLLKQYKEALVDCNKILEDPARANSLGCADAYRLRSIAHFQLENYDAVIKDLTTLIAFRKPTPIAGFDDPEVWKTLGDAHFIKGSYPSAIEAYSKALALTITALASKHRESPPLSVRLPLPRLLRSYLEEMINTASTINAPQQSLSPAPQDPPLSQAALVQSQGALYTQPSEGDQSNPSAREDPSSFGANAPTLHQVF